MIKAYNFSKRGAYHEQTNVVLQDASRFFYINNDWIVGAIADGVGSAPLSHEGSKLAVEESIKYCVENFPKNLSENNLTNLIENAFLKAVSSIFELSEKDENAISDYDTTLDLVLFNGKDLFYGHIGDSGIIVLTEKGEAKVLTHPHKGPDGFSLRPLRSGKEFWDIGKAQDSINSVLMATDGVLEKILHPMLNNKELNQNIYGPLLTFFLSRSPQVEETVDKFLEGHYKSKDFEKVLFFELESLGFSLEELKSIGISFVENRPISNGLMPLKLLSEIRDDKTVLVIRNDTKRKALPPEYYKEIDWNKVNSLREERLYPSLKRNLENFNKDNKNLKDFNVKADLVNSEIKRKRFLKKGLINRNKEFKKYFTFLKKVLSNSNRIGDS